MGHLSNGSAASCRRARRSIPPHGQRTPTYFQLSCPGNRSAPSVAGAGPPHRMIASSLQTTFAGSSQIADGAISFLRRLRHAPILLPVRQVVRNAACCRAVRRKRPLPPLHMLCVLRKWELGPRAPVRESCVRNPARKDRRSCSCFLSWFRKFKVLFSVLQIMRREDRKKTVASGQKRKNRTTLSNCPVW